MEKGGFTSEFFSDSFEGIKVDPDYFKQESTEELKKTLGTPIAEGEFVVADGLTVSDTSALFQDKNKKVEPIKTPESDKPQVVKKILGAHVEVLEAKDRYNNNKLADITFVEGTSCGMSDAIAYIRYWSRTGTAQKNPVQSDTQFVLPDNVSEQLSKQLSELYGNSAKLSSLYTTDFDPNSIQYSPLEGYKAAESFKNLPKNEYFNNGQLPEFPNPIKTSDVDYTKVGKVYGANPSGTTLAHNVTWAAPVNDAVWQFLFNPEELQLSSGPEYNRAEAWGVSDPENSGQPLSWRMNRNRKLTFGKVLLHGYSFGKRVDSLEKGLQDLFMAREGEGSDGPPVLEFVWGKRVFGPCVILNIQVREKAWDKGILVNAEVSFELEQVPEWTINDGFVDVLRPGRQPTVNDPSIASENYRDNSTTRDGSEKEKANDDGGGGGQPSSNQYDPNLCQFASTSASNFYQIASDTDRWLRGLKFDPILPPSQDYIIEVRKIAADFLSIKDRFYSGSTLIGKYVDSKMKTTAPGCTSGGELYGAKAGKNNTQYYRVVKDLLDAGKYKSMVGFINGCVKNTERYIKEWQADPKNLKCQPEREQAAKLAEAAKCQQFQLGRKCDSPGSQTSCPSVNGGKTVFCRRNPNNQGSAFVWSNK